MSYDTHATAESLLADSSFRRGLPASSRFVSRYGRGRSATSGSGGGSGTSYHHHSGGSSLDVTDDNPTRPTDSSVSSPLVHRRDVLPPNLPGTRSMNGVPSPPHHHHHHTTRSPTTPPVAHHHTVPAAYDAAAGSSSLATNLFPVSSLSHRDGDAAATAVPGTDPIRMDGDYKGRGLSTRAMMALCNQLGASPARESLTRLDASSNGFWDSAIINLSAALHVCPRLTYLNLGMYAPCRRQLVLGVDV